MSGIPDPAVKNNRDALIWNGSEWIASRVDWTELTNVPATFAPSAHTHPQGDITGLVAALAAKSDDPHGDADHDATVASLAAGIVPNAELAGSGTPDATTFLRGDRTWAAPPGGGGGITPITITFLASGPTTWTNQPAAITEFGGNPNMMRARYDLTNFSDCRLLVGLRGVGASGASLILQYSTDQSAWTTIATTAIDTGGGSLVESSWTALPAGAKADVYLRLAGENGDGTSDPQFNVITGHFR